MSIINTIKSWPAKFKAESALYRYWKSYGGWKALIKSHYLWLSLILTLILYPAWSAPGWWNDTITIMPSVLGFSLGGYALWLAIGDDEFRKLISGSKSENEPSPYMQVNATFAHFILLQIIAIFTAIIAKAFFYKAKPDDLLYPITQLAIFEPLCSAGYFIGYFIFIYALTTALAATLALFRVSSWYDAHQSITKKQTPSQKDNEKNKS
jgi:hypothetical protein